MEAFEAMTKKYETEFSNGVRLKLKITATTGRPGLPGAGHREASSEVSARFSAKTEPEDVQRVQAECDQFLKTCAADASRLAGGILIFEPVPVPTYENKIVHPTTEDAASESALVQSEQQTANPENATPCAQVNEQTQSTLDASVSGSNTAIGQNGESVAPA